MNLDQQTIDWIEKAISKIQYGEISITFILHQGKVVSRRKKITWRKERRRSTSAITTLRKMKKKQKQ